MRDNLNISSIFITIIIGTMCFFSVFSEASVLLDRVVAVVNKEVITWSELYRMMESEASEQMKALSEKERTKVFKDNEAVFLEKLIDMKLQIQEARRTGLNVGTEETKEAIDNIKKKYSLTDDSLKEYLKKDGITFEEYKKRLAEQILISQFINQQIKNKIVVSEREIKQYIEENKQSMIDREAFKLRQIFLRKPQDETGKKAFEDKLSTIMRKLKAGEDFSVLAKEYSEDYSGKLGGDLGYIKRSLIAKEFIDVLSRMNTGDFSNPFQTEKGFHIIKLDEKISAQNDNELKDNVRKQLEEERFADKYKSMIKGLREKAYIEIRL